MKKSGIFLRGVLMGICDTVPGISGGTIAFITGIYERLINAIKGFSPSLAYEFFGLLTGKGDKKKFASDLKQLDLGFLLTLLAGIVGAILIFSRIIVFLLENYFSFTMAFFVGLILASAKAIFDHIERHHSLNTVLALIGLAIGISLAFLVPQSITPSLGYIFLGGFVAISAMILPGISGSFILLIMGIYEFMLLALKNLTSNLTTIIIFILGAIAGLLSISRVISYLLKKDKSATLYFLLGLVVGSLSVPITDILQNLNGSTNSLIGHIILLILGAIAASSITHFSKNKYLVKN